MSVSDIISEVLPTPTQEELDDFKGSVSEWTKLDDQIRKLSIAISERKTHKKALSEGIQVFMTKYGYTNLSIPSGTIVHSIRKVKQPIKITEVKETLESYKELSGEELFKKIFEKERDVVEKHSIRRNLPKVSMSLDI